MQRLGGIGVVIVDHHMDSSVNNGAPFGMSGDTDDDDIHIAAIFLFRKEGDELRTHMRSSKDHVRANMRSKSTEGKFFITIL